MGTFLTTATPANGVWAYELHHGLRLDAMGAIGIARCFTFGGRFARVLHDPAVPHREGLTRQQYMDRGFQQTTINHLHEKLLKLKVRTFSRPHL